MKSIKTLLSSMSPERQERIDELTIQHMEEVYREAVDSFTQLFEELERNELNEQYLWEILVPQADPDGQFIAVPEHNIWDKKVRDITGGLTIHRSALGNWVSPSGELVVERMIPVRIACTEEEIHKIGQMTKEFYRQEKVMYYQVSDKVFII